MSERDGARIGTSQITTIAYAIASRLVRDLALALVDQLAGDSRPGCNDLVVLDSMATSLPATRRHHCARMNNNTVGGGVLWGLCITARRGSSPLRILSLMEGAWNDGAIIAKLSLIPRGPLYIMDRGFHKIEAMANWLRGGVRFLLRAQTRELVYTPTVRLGGNRVLRAKTSARRGPRRVEVLFDGLAVVGSPQRRGQRPVLRLLDLRLHSSKGNERLVLLSSELRTGAQALLDLYGRRWEIEEFHRVLKRSIGLAHLYSFRQRGIQTLLALAALLAVLLWIGGQTLHSTSGKPRLQTLPQIMRQLLNHARAAIGIDPPWRPNTVGKSSWRHRA